ncbi:MAG: S8 family peptidase [Bacteroidota bacterium]|nr:S8 family peptidase [Bacteroidota bacterium]
MGRAILLLICLYPLSLILHPSEAIAQGNALPGTIAIRITSAAEAAISEAFAQARPVDDPTFRHADIYSASLSDDSIVRSLLGLPDNFHGLRLRPYYPTHSIAFEDIRERSNPGLFGERDGTDGPYGTELLRSTEEKLSRWLVLSFSDSLTPEVAVQLARKSPSIELAETRSVRRPLFTPNDSLFSQQYGLALIHATQAWDIVRCDSTMLLADDDVGTDWTHEDLAANIAINWGETGIDTNGVDKRANGVDDDGNGFIDDWHGWDFDGAYGDTPDNDPRSPDNHGTHTAGIMAAVGNNHKGIAGVAFGARLLPIKTACDNCAGLDFGFQGIIYAADMHAKAVNCSFGGSNFSQAEQDAVNYAFAKDCAVVAASGNDGQFLDIYPGAYQHVLTVAAVGPDGTVTGYSDYNTHVAVSAPGGVNYDIISTVPVNSYAGEHGTSMASPHACGLVGLVRQRFPWMTAGQAMQQVRATAVPQPSDATRHDLVGHGLIDAYAAVTDTKTYSARIENVSIEDDLKLGHFVAGESGGIVLSVQNYLKPVQQLWATLEIFQGSGAITLQSSTVQFGQVGENQTVQNAMADLRLSVSNAVTANTLVTVKVTFHDSIVGYGPDIDYFSFIVSPNYLDLNANNLTVTLSSRGTIGYNDPVTDHEGAGFIWRNAPPAIGPLARSVLFNGGLMIGTDPQHLVDVVINQSDQDANHDFAATETIHSVTPDRGAIQELVCSYSDSLADSVTRVGVNVTQRAYAFSQGVAANAAIVQYVLRKQSGLTDWPASDSTAAALYLDWDIGLSGALNVTRFDSAQNAAITYRIEPNYPFVGMKVISALPPGTSLNYHAIRNDGSQGDINTYAGGFDKSGKWRAMTEFFNPAGPGDISMALGLKNLPMASRDSVEMTVVFALAQSPNLLKETMDSAAALWNGGPAAVSPETIYSLNDLAIYPEPFRDALHVEWPQQSGTGTRVSIIDVLGREIVSQQARGNGCDFESLRLAPGVYFIEVQLPGGRLTKRIIASGS